MPTILDQSLMMCFAVRCESGVYFGGHGRAKRSNCSGGRRSQSSGTMATQTIGKEVRFWNEFALCSKPVREDASNRTVLSAYGCRD